MTISRKKSFPLLLYCIISEVNDEVGVSSSLLCNDKIDLHTSEHYKITDNRQSNEKVNVPYNMALIKPSLLLLFQLQYKENDRKTESAEELVNNFCVLQAHYYSLFVFTLKMKTFCFPTRKTAKPAASSNYWVHKYTWYSV